MMGASGRGAITEQRLQEARGFGALLETAALSILADARNSLTAPDLSDAERVHEVRKALKRLRAWLRLLAEPLGEPAVQMRMGARDLMQALSGARDTQSALDALTDLRATAAAATPPLSAKSLATIAKRLTDMRDTAEQTAFTPAMRERLMVYLESATQTVETWPLASVDFNTVAYGLVATYRRARRLVPSDWNDTDPESLHDLRRRVVEHRHQMDLIEPLWPRLGQVWG